jgi:hypothetical protein
MQEKASSMQICKLTEVSLHYVAELRDKAMLVRLNKEMSNSSTASAALNIGRGETSLDHLRCQKNRPVSVLTSDDQTVRLSLEKVTNWFNSHTVFKTHKLQEKCNMHA